MKIKLSVVDKNRLAWRWVVVHHKTGSVEHNHLPSRDVRIHAANRQRAAKDASSAPVSNIQDFVRAQTAAGIAMANIHASLLATDNDSLVIPKDLSTVKNAIRREDIATRAPMEALFEELNRRGLYYRFSVKDTSNQIRHLFSAHPQTTPLYKFHHDVLIMDCTYKTHLYNIPLLNIIAMTGLNTALPVAQCWHPGGTEEDFTWALVKLGEFLRFHGIPEPSVIVTDRCLACLNALDIVFPRLPSLICLWHMNRNVLSRTRDALGQVELEHVAPGQDLYENTWQTDAFIATYYEAVNAGTEAEFEGQRKVLASKSKY